jgi:1-acyl-sn-glycerol-3-phosphate acyltransferase
LKTDFQGLGRRWKDFGPLDRTKPVHFRFGEAIAVDGTGREAHKAIVDFVTRCLREWGAETADPA